MALLKWSSKYSVGVETMDSQHTTLFGILNDLHSAMMSGQAQSVTGDLLRKLAKYTRDHFTAEEALMAASGYAGTAQHRLKHRDLMKQVDDFSARFHSGESNLSLHLLNFLRDWLTNHIQQEDKLYGISMNQRNIR